jgi:hypothetical protein
MSLAPHTDESLYSRFIKPKQPPAAAGPVAAAPESPGFLIAVDEISKICRRVAIEVSRHRDREKFFKAASLFGAAAEDERSVTVGNTEISRVLWKMPRTGAIVDLAAADRLVDHAIFGLCAVSASGRTSETDDEAIAYVMRTLLFPRKREATRLDMHSLLYKTVRQFNVRLGPDVFAAIVSRRDHRFRDWELADTATIRLFEARYNVDVKNGYTVKQPSLKRRLKQWPLLYK